MFKLQCLAVCFMVYFAIGDASSFSFIKPCKPDDHGCIKASAIAAMPYIVAGIPTMGVPSSDPIVLDDVSADDKDLKLHFKNMKVVGASKCKILDIIRDLKKSTIKLVLECPVKATGQYTLNGKLLFILAEGEGDFIISTNKAHIEATLKIKTVETGGKKHWKITGFDYTYDVKEKALIDLKNLFGGDETRAKPIREVFDHSWKELIDEVGAPIIKELVTKEVDVIQKFFKAAEVHELELS